MGKNDLIITLSAIQKRRLTKVNIAKALTLIMKNHIGEENAISREKLYRTLFKQKDEHDLKSELHWLYVGRAFNYLRKYTKCFCTSGRVGNNFYYFVIKDENDAETYRAILDKNIKAMKTMKRKSLKAVREQWHKKDWYLPGEEPLQIQ